MQSWSVAQRWELTRIEIVYYFGIRSRIYLFGLTAIMAILIYAMIASVINSRTKIIVHFKMNQVEVKVVKTKISSGRLRLTAIFEPQQGFSLYSAALPMNGIDGIGRPTTFKVSSSRLVESSILSIQPTAFNKVFPDLNLSIPIYPQGKVELSRIFNINNTKGDNGVAFNFSYMSCSDDKGCTLPVKDKQVRLSLSSLF